MKDDHPDWLNRLAELLAGAHTTTGDPLDAGAQITLTDPDGQHQTLALARHHRLEQDAGQPDVLWLRPITGRQPAAAGMPPTCNLDVARRRGFTADQARLDGDRIVLDLTDGATAHIEPAEGQAMTDLADWDTFYYTALDEATRQELVDLYADSFGI